MASTVAEPILGGMVACRPEPISYQPDSVAGFTLMSDLHIGAPHIDYPLINRELEKAKAKGDRVLINGDVFDMILLGDKKRFRGDVLHPRLQGRNNVVTAAVQWGAEILAPYADMIDMIGVGNHETAVERFHSVDPIELLLYELEKALPANAKHVIHHGGYCGFVDYRFRYRGAGGKNKSDDSTGGKRWVIYYHHGGGASAPVTKGMIDFSRKDVFIDADLLWLGHKHNRWNAHVCKISCPLVGDDVLVRDVRHIMTGAYQKTYVGQSQKSIRKDGRRSNYAADAGLAPQGMGGARVEIHFRVPAKPFEVTVTQ